MHAVIYKRVSDPKQEQSGLGLEAQEAACRAWATREGVEVAGVWQDVLGGPTPPADRPGLTAAFAALSAGDVLLVAKRDRLARDPYWMISIERVLAGLGSRLVSAAGEASDDDTPTGILIRGVLDLFAQFERLTIRARTKAAKQAARARGSYCGGKVPAGRRVEDGKLVDSGAVAEARKLRALGLSLRAVAFGLEGRGFVQANGRIYSASSVARMVKED